MQISSSKETLFVTGILVLIAASIFLIKRVMWSDADSQQMAKTPNSAFKITSLHVASKNGEMATCRELIGNGADVNAFDDFGLTPLICAVQNDHVELARYLLEKNARMHYHYQRQDTPEERKKQKKQQALFRHEFHPKESLEEIFKDLPEDLREELSSEETMRDLSQSMIDFHFALTSEHAMDHCTSIPMLKLLVIDFKADINHIDGEGYWPLSSFAESADIPAVTWLLEHGADPNNTSTGETAIFKAIRQDHLEMVKLLIKHGAKIDVTDVDGWTVIFACESVSMAQYLIAEGADPTTLDQAEFPCWHFVEDPATRSYLMQEAKKRGLKKWTELP